MIKLCGQDLAGGCTFDILGVTLQHTGCHKLLFAEKVPNLILPDGRKMIHTHIQVMVETRLKRIKKKFVQQ